MRQKHFWLVLAVCMLLPVVLLAADVTGKWKAEFTTPDGTVRVNTFTFKVDGASLTGTVAGSQDEAPIKNGKISGDDISFSAERQWGNFTYAGKVKGDVIVFKVSVNDQSYEMTAKRAAN